MSRQAKTGLGIAAAVVGLLVGILTLSQTVWASGGEFAVLESRVDRVERDVDDVRAERKADSERMRRIEIQTAKICAAIPGCR